MVTNVYKTVNLSMVECEAVLTALKARKQELNCLIYEARNDEDELGVLVLRNRLAELESVFAKVSA